jgi:hypothetical protein
MRWKAPSYHPSTNPMPKPQAVAVDSRNGCGSFPVRHCAAGCLPSPSFKFPVPPLSMRPHVAWLDYFRVPRNDLETHGFNTPIHRCPMSDQQEAFGQFASRPNKVGAVHLHSHLPSAAASHGLFLTSFRIGSLGLARLRLALRGKALPIR